MAKDLAQRAMKLKLLEAMKSISESSGEYSDTKIDQKKGPRLWLTAKSGAIAVIDIVVDVTSGELCYEIADVNDLVAQSYITKLDERMRQAYRIAFPNEAPAYPNSTQQS
jgi:membrane-bound lytic murein transglycosylase MltF